MAGREISFELERFEWVTPERLEVEGSWNGVRRLVRATLLIEVDGETRRLRALPGDGGSPEEWSAAFAWDGKEMPKLEGAELEVGRSIVVDLPRPRTSKARGAAKPQKPIPATTRAEKQAEPPTPGRPSSSSRGPRPRRRAARARRPARRARGAPRLTAAERSRASEELARRAGFPPRPGRSGRRRARFPPRRRRGLRAELDSLRARSEEAAVRARMPSAPQAEEAATERDSLRAADGCVRSRARFAPPSASPPHQAQAAASEGDSLRSELDSLRARVEDAEMQRDALRAQADEAIDLRAELESLRARAEDGKPAVTPDVARLRAELESVERERSQLRAKLDATQPMPPPTEDTPRRFDRRPAERTAKRTAPEPTVSLADKVTDWVGTVIGTRERRRGIEERREPRPDAHAPTGAAAPAARHRRRRTRARPRPRPHARAAAPPRRRTPSAAASRPRGRSASSPSACSRCC